MRVKGGFLKTRLGEQTYVLPYGQNIADYCEGIALNETGEILWEGLEKECSPEELVRLLEREYQVSHEMESVLYQDVEQFQKHLSGMGMLEEEGEEDYGWNPLYFSIGPMKIVYKGPEIVYEGYFRKFLSEMMEEVDLTIQVSCVPPRYHKCGRVILRNEEVILMDGGQEYVFLFPGFPVLSEMHVKKDGSRALLFCRGDLVEEQVEDIFHGIRFAILLTASEKGLFFLHSASFLYQGRVWLFSGKSGTGKSTHVNLWKQSFDVELLNGDLNMIGREGDKLYVYGQPWCGTSGICTEKSYPLGGITFLKQAEKNVCEVPDTSEKILAMVQRMISPAWERELLERNISFAKKVEACCPVWRLYCTPDREAAVVMKKEIDRSL